MIVLIHALQHFAAVVFEIGGDGEAERSEAQAFPSCASAE